MMKSPNDTSRIDEYLFQGKSHQLKIVVFFPVQVVALQRVDVKISKTKVGNGGLRFAAARVLMWSQEP